VQTLQVQVVTRRNAKTHRWVSKLVLGTANFHVVARNAGDVALTNVTVHDARSPACTRSIARLAPGASVAYACTARNVGRNFTNRIAVSGMPDHADAPVRALASVRVKVKPKRHSSHVPPPAFQQGAQISHAPALPLTG
jgi:hypothetical protein